MKEPIMPKETKPTIQAFIDSLSPAERKKYDEEYREFILSEIIIAAMEEDEVSVRQLAKLAGVSPTIVQAMRSGKKKDFTMKSFFRILKGLGYSILIEKNGKTTPLGINT